MVWTAIKEFCNLINWSARSKRKIPEATLMQAMAAFMYRLLHSRFASESFEEAIRLALLAFCTQAFLQLPSLKLQDTSLAGEYRECLINIGTSSLAPAHVVLWLQMVGAVIVFGAQDHEWLKPLLRTSIDVHGIRSWNDLGNVLNSAIWINLLLDQPGERVFNLMRL
jgi:hypothetical protein